MASGKLQRVKLAIKAIEDGLLVVLLTGMIGLGVAQILLRNLWQTSLSWGDPLLRIALLWLTLLGAIVATRDRNHIRIDLLSHFLPPVPRRWSQLECTNSAVTTVSAVKSHQAPRSSSSNRDRRDGRMPRMSIMACCIRGLREE